MKKVEVKIVNRVEIRNAKALMLRKVTKFGTSAKVDCPRRYLGRTVYLVII
jgi:putative transposon-encoded protein